MGRSSLSCYSEYCSCVHVWRSVLCGTRYLLLFTFLMLVIPSFRLSVFQLKVMHFTFLVPNRMRLAIILRAIGSFAVHISILRCLNVFEKSLDLFFFMGVRDLWIVYTSHFSLLTDTLLRIWVLSRSKVSVLGCFFRILNHFSISHFLIYFHFISSHLTSFCLISCRLDTALHIFYTMSSNT